VEGYMDAISLAAAGVGNVVASLGTAFTANQAKLLMRYAKKLYFAYDSDEAGQTATVRAMGLAENVGAEIFVIEIPDGKDPDEFIRKHGKDEFLELVKNALPLVDFRLQYVLKRTNTDTLDGKVRALHDMLPALAGLRDEAKRIYYQKKLAGALMLDEGVVRNEIGRVGRFVPTVQTARKAVRRRENALDRAGRILIKEAVEDEAALSYLKETLPTDIIESESQKEIFARLFEYGADIDITKLSEDAAAEISRALVEEYESEAYIDALKLFERQDLNIRYQRKSRELEEAIIRGDDGEEALEALREIKKALSEL
ncbi:MAG: toprim domain-containing protein, partial [Selenomonadaceae bacterium]|nr:toprim domain-containing protein [Selenomonadaceae bacterium]